MFDGELLKHDQQTKPPQVKEAEIDRYLAVEGVKAHFWCVYKKKIRPERILGKSTAGLWLYNKYLIRKGITLGYIKVPF